MTFRSSDLQSDSDLDSIRNSCDVLFCGGVAQWVTVTYWPIFSIVKITFYSRQWKLTSKVIIRIRFLQVPISGNWITMWHLHSMMGGFVSMNFQISHDHNPSYSISRWVQSETYYTLSLCLCLTLFMCLPLCLPLCLLLCLSLCLSVTLSLSRAMKMLMEAVLRWHSD